MLRDLFNFTVPHTQVLAMAVMEAVEEGKRSKNKDSLLGWKHASRNLTMEERDRLRAQTAEKFLNILRSLPSDKEFEAAARAGIAKKGWYAASARALQDVFGADTPRFAGLLASLSPQVSVTENMRNAIRFWEKWIDAGRPQTVEGLDEVGKAAVGFRWDGGFLKDPKTGELKKTAGMSWRNNALRAMQHPSPEKMVLTSGGTPTNPHVGKVDSFRANLLGNLARVTNDAWMASFAELDQQLFSTKQGYLAMTAKVRDVAKKMGWEPAEVQETVWSFFKALGQHRPHRPRQDETQRCFDGRRFLRPHDLRPGGARCTRKTQS